MTNNLKDKIKDILFFQSEPMSSNMLADWQVDQATDSILTLINQKEKEAVVAFAEGCIAGPMQDGFYTMSKSEMQNRIKQLKEELKGGKD